MSSEKVLFGQRLRQLRQAKGWSQEELSVQAKLDRTYVGGVERGERNLSLTNICRLAETLGVHPSTLFDWQGIDVE